LHTVSTINTDCNSFAVSHSDYTHLSYDHMYISPDT